MEMRNNDRVIGPSNHQNVIHKSWGWINHVVRVVSVIMVVMVISSLVTLINACLQVNDCQEFSDEYYPNQIGNWWVYERFDSLSMERSDLRVEIVGESVHKDGNKYTIWIFGKNNLYDTLYVRKSGDSILQYRYTDGSPMETLILPLSQGKYWHNPFMFFDTTRVAGPEKLITPAGIYDNSWRLTRKWYAFNEFISDNRWFVPYLGIVKLERSHRLWGPISNETWELKNYSFSKH